MPATPDIGLQALIVEIDLDYPFVHQKLSSASKGVFPH
jgi:hypothetical protein